MNNYDIGTSGSCSGIYCFENLLDKKKYVGQGQLLKERKTAHFKYLRNNKDSEYFQIAWNKDGKENFKFYIIEECSLELLNKREIYWIAELHSYFIEWGYNKTHGGQCIRGYKHSFETIQKLKKIKSGKNNGMYGKRGKNSPNWGKSHSPETIQKIKKSKIGTHPSPETIQKMKESKSGEKNPFYGKKHTKEAKQKQRKSRLGKKSNEKTIQKLRESKSGERNPFYGKKHTLKSIQKMINNKPDTSGINNSRITKKEIIQQIKNMLDKNIKIVKIAKELKISVSPIYKVKNGWYKNIYGI